MLKDKIFYLTNSHHSAASSSLQTVTLPELYDTAYMPATALIDNFLYSGVYILAGPPKTGKSFLMAQLAYHVAAGMEFFNHKVTPASVLYLSLEDDLVRLQKRFSRMFGIEGNANLYLATKADSLNQGLEEQLTDFLQSKPATKLVIIDTLQKIREFTSSSYSYASDYHIINILKEIAARYNICIVVVHHTRKMEAEDKFDKISGTTGLLGAADGAMILQKEKRTVKRAQLNIVGRELPDQEIIIEFMPENCTWKFIRSCQQLWEESKDLLLEQVAALVSDENKIWHGSATQMLQALNISTDDIKPHILSRRLNVKVDKLYNDYGIYYHNKRSNKGSDITLKKLDAKTA